MNEWRTVADIIHQLETFDNPHALNDPSGDHWISLSSKEAVNRIKYLTLALEDLNIKKGDCIGLMASPCSAWMIVSLALLAKGAVVVPLFPNISEENFLLEVDETKMKKIFVRHLQPIPILDQHMDLFEKIIEFNELEEIYKKGEKKAEENPKGFETLLRELKENDLCTIIYTSATTGAPKGVMLGQVNLVKHMYDLPIKVITEKRYLNVIPLAHIFGYILNFMILCGGGALYFASDPKNFLHDCATVHPTITAIVPRFLEKFYLGLNEKIGSLKGINKWIGQTAIKVAYSDKPGWVYRLFFPFWDKYVYSKVRESFGGSMELVISGSAPLNPQLNHFFQNIGVPVREGWGLTEACPVTVNPLEPHLNKVGTVGIPYDGWKIKIAPDGEVLVKGSGVMKGYLKPADPDAKLIDGEGWLHTGDKGSLDADGYLKIEGRMKEIFKTSTGEWVAPVPIEQLICQAPYIEMAMVVAEGRKFASALLFPNYEYLAKLKNENMASHLSDEEFLETPEMQQKVADHIEKINEHLNHWEQVHAFRFITKPPSIEEGELTPSLKLRREIIQKKYQHLIDEMYAER